MKDRQTVLSTTRYSLPPFVTRVDPCLMNRIPPFSFPTCHPPGISSHPSQDEVVSYAHFPPAVALKVTFLKLPTFFQHNNVALRRDLSFFGSNNVYLPFLLASMAQILCISPLPSFSRTGLLPCTLSI